MSWQAHSTRQWAEVAEVISELRPIFVGEKVLRERIVELEDRVKVLEAEAENSDSESDSELYAFLSGDVKSKDTSSGS